MPLTLVKFHSTLINEEGKFRTGPRTWYEVSSRFLYYQNIIFVLKLDFRFRPNGSYLTLYADVAIWAHSHLLSLLFLVLYSSLLSLLVSSGPPSLKDATAPAGHLPLSEDGVACGAGRRHVARGRPGTGGRARGLGS